MKQTILQVVTGIRTVLTHFIEVRYLSTLCGQRREMCLLISIVAKVRSISSEYISKYINVFCRYGIYCLICEYLVYLPVGSRLVLALILCEACIPLSINTVLRLLSLSLSCGRDVKCVNKFSRENK